MTQDPCRYDDISYLRHPEWDYDEYEKEEDETQEETENE